MVNTLKGWCFFFFSHFQFLSGGEPLKPEPLLFEFFWQRAGVGGLFWTVESSPGRGTLIQELWSCFISQTPASCS